VALLMITKNSKNVTLCMHDKNANKNWIDGKKKLFESKATLRFLCTKISKFKTKKDLSEFALFTNFINDFTGTIILTRFIVLKSSHLVTSLGD